MHTRPTWAEVSLEKLAANFRAIRARVAPSAEVCAIVKADAYGHGAVPCARALEQAGAKWFGVACVDEGIQLREAGIRQRILVMGGIWREEAKAALAHELTPSVWELFHLDWLESAARQRRQKPHSVPVHLEIDTGMSRQGVLPKDIAAILGRFSESSPLKLEGVYSHFASSEVADGKESMLQARAYEHAVAEVLDRGLVPEFTHLANSAAIATHPEVWNEARRPKLANGLVRPGLALYGYNLPLTNSDGALTSLAGVPVQPVMSWKSRIISLRDLPAGQPVGYGGTFVTTRASRVASIPLGYADGLSRRLSNRGHMLVRGVPVPIVGNVSMDITVIDVTDVPTATMSDEVVLIGSQQGATISADDLASAGGTISYEVLCGIGKRVPRLYVE